MLGNFDCLVIFRWMCTLLLQCEHTCPLIVSPQVILVPEYLLLLLHLHKLLFLVLPYQQLSIFNSPNFLDGHCHWGLMLLMLFEPWLWWCHASISSSFLFNSGRDKRSSLVRLLHLLEPLLSLCLLGLKLIWLVMFKHVSPLIRGASLLY